jgi:hypothetical protein
VVHQVGSLPEKKKTGNVCVCATTVAVEQQLVFHIPSARL